MRYGICCGIDGAERAVSAGFDYVELPASSLVALGSGPEATALAGLPVKSTNLFFPGHFRLSSQSEEEILAYSRQAVERAASLGAKVMVIGSGAARSAPEGASGLDLFVATVAKIAEVAGPYSIEVAPESLNRGETNVGNDLAELSARLAQLGVGFTVDTYHVLKEADDPRDPALWVRNLPMAPTHVHVAALEGRLAPEPGNTVLRSFVLRLIDLGYDGLVSLECARPDDFSLERANDDLRSLFAV